MTKQALQVVGLTKSFDAYRAVDEISFEVGAGEFVTLLGPSGCGKTTTLRMIAGLEQPDAGVVQVGDRVLTSVEQRIVLPPERRGMGMVFQNYAIWPHMTVFENVAFPLQRRKMPAPQIREHVTRMLRTVGLDGFADRPAPLLSGGQQQRVALARALVSDPVVLLLDEPLSNLDAHLREEMRFEIKEVQARIGITTVFVTHDQEEALTMSDRVIVMNAGHIEQNGAPRELYEAPRSAFVVNFLGQVNHLQGRVENDGSLGPVLRVPDEQGRSTLPLAVPEAWPVAAEVTIAFRAESGLVRPPGGGSPTGLHGVIQSSIYLGRELGYVVRVGDTRIRVRGETTSLLRVGDPVEIAVGPSGVFGWLVDDDHNVARLAQPDHILQSA
jgi:iron(III) transport system ATP-binding protein